MTSHESSGLWRRIVTALGGALSRGILGKSTHDSTGHFTGSDRYWDRAIAAQLGWPQEQLPGPDPVSPPGPAHAAMHARPRIRGTGRRTPDSGYEPVHGWTRRQLDDYLARNPGYRSTYEAELHKRCRAAAPEGNGSSLGWFRPWRIHRDQATTSSAAPKGGEQACESPAGPLCGL